MSETNNTGQQGIIGENTVPPPVDIDAVLASVPTVQELMDAPDDEGFRPFVMERLRHPAIIERFGELPENELLDVWFEDFNALFLTAAGTEEAMVQLREYLGRGMHLLEDDDGTLARLVLDILRHPTMQRLSRDMIRIAMVAPLQMERPALAEDVIALVHKIACRAGDREWEVFARFNSLAARWDELAIQRNALLAVFDCVETDNEAILAAAGLLEMSVLLETRIAPFVEALDDVLIVAGLHKPDRSRTFGKSFIRVQQRLRADFPEHASLLDTDWIHMRNATLHGAVGRTEHPAPPDLVTKQKTGDRTWPVGDVMVELQRLHDLVGPLGAVPTAVKVLAAEFILRFADDLVETMISELEGWEIELEDKMTAKNLPSKPTQEDGLVQGAGVLP